MSTTDQSPTDEPDCSKTDTPRSSEHTQPVENESSHMLPESVWKNREFRWLWGSETSAHFGREISLVLVPLIGALTLNASPFEMGVLGAALTAPALVVGPFIGVWVDRLRRRSILIVANLLRALVILTIPLSWYAGFLTVEVLTVAAFASGSLVIFNDLASYSILPTILDRRQLVDANGRITMSRSLGQSLAPPLAGGLTGLFNGPLTILLEVKSALAASWLISHLKPGEMNAVAIKRTGFWRETLEGIRLSLRQPLLRTIIGANALTNFGGHIFISIEVLYLATELGLSAFTIGLILGLGGTGGVIGSFLAGPLARRLGLGRIIIGGWLVFGLGGLPIALAVLVPAYALPMVLIAEFVQWGALEIARINQISLRQAITPAAYQGRVAGTERFVGNGMIPIGSLVGGSLGSLIGIQPTLLVGVVGMLLAFVWTAVSPLRGMQKQPETTFSVASVASN